MQNNTRSVSRTGIITLCLILVMLLFSLTVSAQEPTATPSDPIWLGLSIARDIVQEQEGVDLTVMQKMGIFPR